MDKIIGQAKAVGVLEGALKSGALLVFPLAAEAADTMRNEL